MEESLTTEFMEEKGHDGPHGDGNHHSHYSPQDNGIVEGEEPAGHVKKGVIDLSLGLEEVSPVKVKRGSIDLSLGLAYQEPEQQTKAPVPSSLLKFGLERQVSDEQSRGGGAGGEDGVTEISPELLKLLQPTGESSEAWEEKMEERKRFILLTYERLIYFSEQADLNPSDILSKLGFSEGLESVAEGETWESKTACKSCLLFTPSSLMSAHATDATSPEAEEKEIDPAKLMGMLGIAPGDDAGEAWEKKTSGNTSDLI